MARLGMLRTQVLIIGGGPSGMVAALCLAACGVKSVIVEKRSTPSRHPKGHEVSARTLEILTQLGIPFKELEAEASPHEDASRILFCRTLNEEIGRIDLNEKSIREKYAAHTALPRPYLNLSQTELEKVLRRHVTKNKSVTLLTGAEWKSLSQQADGVTCVARRAEGEVLEIRCDYVFSCDGAGGKCRDFLGIRMTGPEKIQDVVNAYFTDDLRAKIKTPAKLFFVFKPDAVGTFIAHHAAKRWVYHVPVMTPHEKIEDYTEDVFRERIAKAMGDPHFKANIQSISSWRMTAQVAETFQKGRVFLVGDSAHRFPPTGGLGLNSGVADAHNLAWKIAAVLNGEASPELLASYEKERKPVVAVNSEESRRNFFNLLKIPAALGINAHVLPWIMACLALPPLRWLGKGFRKSALRLIFDLGDKMLRRYATKPKLQKRVQSAVSEQISHFDRIGLDLGFHYGRDADLTRTTQYAPDFSPGSRLPVFSFRQSGREIISHTLIRYTRFSLLIGEKALSLWRRHAHALHTDIQLKLAAVPETVYIGGKAVAFPRTGAILIRPDGHIAANFSSADNAYEALAQYFENSGFTNWRIAS